MCHQKKYITYIWTYCYEALFSTFPELYEIWCGIVLSSLWNVMDIDMEVSRYDIEAWTKKDESFNTTSSREIFMSKVSCILIQVSMVFVAMGPIDNKNPLVQIMA